MVEKNIQNQIKVSLPSKKESPKINPNLKSKKIMQNKDNRPEEKNKKI